MASESHESLVILLRAAASLGPKLEAARDIHEIAALMGDAPAGEALRDVAAAIDVARRRERYDALLEKIPAAIAVVRGPDSVYELSNAENDRLIGRRIEIGKTAREVVPELVAQGLVDIADRVRATGEPFIARELAVDMIDGGGVPCKRFVDCSYHPIGPPGGAPDGVLAFAYDVSHYVEARRDAEALAVELDRERRAVAESEARARRLQDSGVIGVVFWTRDGVLLDANDAFLRMVGYTRDDLANGRVRWNEMTPPEFAERDAHAFAEMDRQGFCRPYEKEYIHRDGRRVPISLGVAFWEGSTTSGVAWILDISERKSIERERERALAELDQARMLLQSLIDHAPAAIFLKDLEGRLILVNKTAAAAAGLRPEDAIGKTDHDLLPASAADSYRRDDLRVVAENAAIEIEEEAFAGDERRFAHTVKFPVRAQDGRVYATGGFSLDITERKRLEDAMTLQSRVLQSMAEGVVVFEDKGVIVFTNPAEDAMFGYAPGELVGQHVTVQNAYAPEENERVVADVMRRLKKDGVWSGEFQNVKKDGTLFVTRARITTLELSGRKHFVCVQADVTEERRRQADEAFLARVGVELTSSLDRATIIDAVVRLCVPDRCDVCAVYLATAGGGMELASIVHAEAARTERLERLHAEEPGLGPDAFDRVLDAAGATAAKVIPLVAQGRTIGVIAFARAGSRKIEDGAVLVELAQRLAVTIDHVQLFEMTQRERRRAEEASRAKDELLSVTSHELRTPLNAIVGWTAMLRAGRLSEAKRAHALATIERNARAQVQLVDDILDVSRVFTGKLRLDVSLVDPRSVVEQAVDVLRPAAEAKGVAIHVDVSRASGDVLADPGRLQQICWNLVSNAVKFTPAGGRVDVRLHRDAGVQLVVTDTGRGIAPPFLPHVFEPFRQEDGSTTRVHGGIGLGLAIVKHLVELHGGSVTASSEGVGKGASFVVRIPVSPATATALPSVARDVARETSEDVFPGATQLRGLRVLVVDDEPDARDLLESILAQCDVEIMLATSAAEAFERFRRTPADLIISDIGMGGESGYDLIAKIRALPPELGGSVPAIALTAYAGAADRAKALSLGFTTHATKPTAPRELIALVASVSGRRAATEAGDA